MSWYFSSNDGGYKKSKWGEGELGRVHRPLIIRHNGMEHSLVDYESHNSEQYMARTAKVVKYRRFPGMADEKYIFPSKTEEYGRFNSPPSKDHHRTTHGKSGNLNFDSDLTDEEEEEEDLSVNNTNGTRPNNMKEQEYHNDEKNNRYGFTKEGSRPNHLRDQEDYYERVNPKTNGYNPPTYTVPISTRQDKEKGDNYATRARMGPFFGTPPRNETSYETSNFKPIANSPPQFNPQPNKEQGNDYATGARMGPFFGTPPRNETSHETSNFKPIANSPPQFNPQPKKEQGNDYATGARMGPFFGTSPRNETSYETSNFKPTANSPPQFNPQPKKEQGNNQETIDSTDARRRYGMGAPGAGPGLYAEDRYSGGTIDSKEAARRYNGVLLNN